METAPKTSAPTADLVELELGERVVACLEFENYPGFGLMFVTTLIDLAQATCPECRELLEILTSGTKCSNPECTYWACY